MGIPPIVYQIINLIVSLIRFLAMGVLGVALGWLVIDLLKKVADWRVQIAALLGLLGLVIAISYLLPGAMGAFAIGLSIAIFIWGLPKKKEEKSD